MLFKIESIMTARQMADFDTPVTNFINYQYSADIYLGSELRPFNVNIDTGSNKLIIMSDACSDC